jgi:hypothetical protein
MLATPTINEEEIRHSDYFELGTELAAKGLITLTFTARYHPEIEKSAEGAVRTDRSERQQRALFTIFCNAENGWYWEFRYHSLLSLPC